MSKTPTAQEIESALRQRIARAECLLQIAGIIRETARKMEGKAVNKRFHTAAKARIQEAMGNNFGVSWEADTFGWKLYVWDGSYGDNSPAHTPKWNDRAMFSIGRGDIRGLRDPQETISEAWIVENNPGYFMEAERLPKLRAALDGDKAQEWANKAALIASLRAELGADMAEYEASYIVKMP